MKTREQVMAGLEKIAVGNLGEEEFDQLKWERRTRSETRAEAENLFSSSVRTLAKDRRQIKDLFVQTPGARLGAGLEEAMPVKTAAVNSFFEKRASASQFDSAQRRFPELQKFAAASDVQQGTPNLKKRPAASAVRGETPVQSSVSGGSA